MQTVTQSRRDRDTQPTRGRTLECWLPVGHYDPDFTKAVLDELDRLSQLPENWDSYGAPPIDQQIITAAKKFIVSLPENLASRPRVVPMSPGNLQFEWHHQGKILELEFETPTTIHFLQWQPEAEVEEEDTFSASDVDRAVDLIQWFMSGTTV